MDSLVVYHSKFGNTKQLAEEIAKTFASEGNSRLLSLEELSVADLQSADLVVIGVPTHRMNLPQAVKEKFSSLPRRILRRVPIAAFDTSYKMSRWLAPFTASRKVVSRLRRLGGKRIIPGETFHVVGKEGPLYRGELARASQWAEDVLSRSRKFVVKRTKK